jgi:glycosyltransferase involved in cell wall biosynthesis
MKGLKKHLIGFAEFYLTDFQHGPLSSMIKLSIICPTHNRIELLRDCVRSAMPLLREGAEFILVDDASTDGTDSLAREFQREFGERFRYERLEKKSGAQVARNRGMELATGGVVLFLDSDDVLVTGGVFRLLRVLEEKPELDFVFGKVLRVDKRLRADSPPREVGQAYSNADAEIAGYHWHTMGAVYRMECAQRVGPWNLDLTGSQDWEYQARVKLFGGRGEFVDTVTGLWRQHQGNRVGTDHFRPDYVRSVMKACESIERHARSANRCDAALRKRLSKKLVVHALEWGANGYAVEKVDCLRLARGMAPEGSYLQRLCDAFRLTPQAWDKFLCRKIYGRL